MTDAVAFPRHVIPQIISMHGRLPNAREGHQGAHGEIHKSQLCGKRVVGCFS